MYALLLALLVLLLFGFLPYLNSVYYRFPDEGKFEGDIWYNPYENLNKKLIKANFQVQSRAWMGLTDGSTNSSKEVLKVYQDLGYDVIGISDYMKINSSSRASGRFISVYEHGYNIWKRHQILIGANKVKWLDYPFLQSIHHKQQIINYLKGENQLICISHPLFFNSYIPNDFRKLTNYDIIEIASIFGNSLEQWDAALSSGKYITAIANDDAHNLQNNVEYGRFFTMIDTYADLFEALKYGRSYAVEVREAFDQDKSQKLMAHQQMSKLKDLKIDNNTLIVSITKPGDISLIGQGGTMISKVLDTSKVKYSLKDSDTYIRVQVEFENGNKMYLNPVVRTQTGVPAFAAEELKVNIIMTILVKLMYAIIIFLNFFMILMVIKWMKRC
ncbi:MAG: hypothetical protein CL663_00575 [Bacteroidetes bacterium]|nr:hypothetical protein [Bacteroidota bacterium]